MNDDTVKIKRPMCCRRHEDLGGRCKQDSEGNTTKVRTRADDSQYEVDPLELTVDLEEGPAGS